MDPTINKCEPQALLYRFASELEEQIARLEMLQEGIASGLNRIVLSEPEPPLNRPDEKRQLNDLKERLLHMLDRFNQANNRLNGHLTGLNSII